MLFFFENLSFLMLHELIKIKTFGNFTLTTGKRASTLTKDK